MTKREREIFQAVSELEKADPTGLSQKVGISPDYAEQICRDMVWQKHLVKKGRFYEAAQR